MIISPHATLAELLETWHRWSYRDTLTRLIAQADAEGNTERAKLFCDRLAREPHVEPLQALAANHELTSLLRGWQWHAVRAAREAGASWIEVAKALGGTVEQARADYLGHIERAERHNLGLTDTTLYRAVLDDPARSKWERVPSFSLAAPR